MDIHWLYLLVSVACLYFGAELLVKGAVGLAKGFDVRPTLVGLTVVAFGTSVPELTVSVLASARGACGIALGNIIGSNIANAGLIVGLAALIRPLTVERKLVRREVPIGIFASVLFFVLALDGRIGRIDGAILFLGMAAFIIFVIRQAISEKANGAVEFPRSAKKIGLNLFLVIIGIIAVVGGGHLFLKTAIFVAQMYGISEFFIGVTMVAVGTSLPELATSMVAAFRRQDDLCVSNIVGSNIINIFCGIGLAALVRPLTVDAGLLGNEFLFLIGFSLALLPLLKTGLSISRVEGGILLAAYAAFIYFAYVK